MFFCINIFRSFIFFSDFGTFEEDGYCISINGEILLFVFFIYIFHFGFNHIFFYQIEVAFNIEFQKIPHEKIKF